MSALSGENITPQIAPSKATVVRTFSMAPSTPPGAARLAGTFAAALVSTSPGRVRPHVLDASLHAARRGAPRRHIRGGAREHVP